MCLICCVQHAVVYAGGLHDLFLSHLNIRILCFELLLIVLFVFYVSSCLDSVVVEYRIISLLYKNYNKKRRSGQQQQKQNKTPKNNIK